MLTARPLSIWDAAFCWRLANEPSVRESAVDRTPPSWWGHCRWMLAWLFKSDRQAWVIQDEWGAWFESAYNICYKTVRTQVGLARVTTAGVVSIEVLPRRRGCGVGLLGVRVATEYAEAHGWSPARAHIRGTNKASIGLFAKAGYEMASADGEWVMMERAA